MFDLGPATETMTRLITSVTDDQLDDPTPCDDWTVAALLAHVHQFSVVFTANAAKQPVQPPSELVDEWRAAIPAQLAQLAEAWRQSTAWEGRVSAGGVDMSAPQNAVVAVEELTIHGWDLARATGQGFVAVDADLDQVDRFVELFGSGDGGPFGPRANTPEGAGRLQRLVAATGRDPEWAPPSA